MGDQTSIDENVSPQTRWLVPLCRFENNSFQQVLMSVKQKLLGIHLLLIGVINTAPRPYGEASHANMSGLVGS